jgi:hypothetical protein
LGFHRRRALLALPLAAVLLLAACGGDGDDDDVDTASAATAVPAGRGSAVDLAGVCPSTIVIQTDWNPELEHGALYELLGADREIDADDKSVKGSLVASGGIDTGVDLEIRVGGPAIGFQDVSIQMLQDPDITLGYVATDEAIKNWAKIQTKAVVAPLEVNPQIVMWDPATYPDVHEIKDLRAHHVTIRYFETVSYMRYLVNSGQVAEDQLDGGYDGSPTVFTAEGGKIAQQGFASAEPYIYEHEVEDWAKPVAFQLVHDAGWQSYAAPLAVRADELDELRPCLERFVPIVQQAVVDVATDPSHVSPLILELVEAYATGWVYSAGVAGFAARQLHDLGLEGNGPDDVVGNFDRARLDAFIPKALGVFRADDPTVAELAMDDLVTNEFIDDAIGLPG